MVCCSHLVCFFEGLPSLHGTCFHLKTSHTPIFYLPSSWSIGKCRKQRPLSLDLRHKTHLVKMTNLNVDEWIVPESDSLYEFSGQNCIEERMFKSSLAYRVSQVLVYRVWELGFHTYLVDSCLNAQ